MRFQFGTVRLTWHLVMVPVALAVGSTAAQNSICQAFSQLTSYGAQLMVLKTGRVLQLQYSTSKRGTNADLAALRGVAKKAIVAF